jgi:hypothetical protein
VLATGGFPHVIASSGSYVLTGDLTAPADTTAVRISASDVTLDLNGFATRAFGAAAGNGPEISGAVARVRDGLITGAVANGVLVQAEGARLENLTVRANSLHGIRVLEDRAEIVGCTVIANGFDGVSIGAVVDAAVERSVLAGNTGVGARLLAGGSARFERNVVRGNPGGTTLGAFFYVLPNYCNGVAACPRRPLYSTGATP